MDTDRTPQLNPWILGFFGWPVVGGIWMLAVGSPEPLLGVAGFAIGVAAGSWKWWSGPRIAIARDGRWIVQRRGSTVSVSGLARVTYSGFGFARLHLVFVGVDGREQRLSLGTFYRWGWRRWGRLVVAIAELADPSTSVDRSARSVIPLERPQS